MTIQKTTYVATIMLLLSLLVLAPTVFAHGDEEHEDGNHTEATTMSTAQMEQMIALLTQLVAVLTEYKAQYGAYVAPTAMYATPVLNHDEHTEADEHKEVHTEVTTEAKFVIEIEPHNGMTHAHVRYTDKPEEMFFISAVIGDEAAIVAELSTKTGLSADVVQAALKYMQ